MRLALACIMIMMVVVMTTMMVMMTIMVYVDSRLFALLRRLQAPRCICQFFLVDFEETQCSYAC